MWIIFFIELLVTDREFGSDIQDIHALQEEGALKALETSGKQ